MMRGMRVLFVGSMLASLGLAQLVHAEERSQPTAYDCRIRRVVYNPADVVDVTSTPGIETHLILDPDETYVTHAWGDSGAWWFRHMKNHVFIKPREANSDTNLTIVTNKRSYNFYIHYIDRPKKDDCSEVFQVSFGYVDKQRAQVAKAEEAEAARAEKHSIASAFKVPPPRANLDYEMSLTPSDQIIAPENAWDDGRFTKFKFPANEELPRVYIRYADNTEAIVNTWVEGKAKNILVTDRIAKRFTLRLGNNVVGIYNEGFKGGTDPGTSGTASDEVKRVIKGASDGD